jgi:hypothetical protein
VVQLVTSDPIGLAFHITPRMCHLREWDASGRKRSILFGGALAIVL